MGQERKASRGATVGALLGLGLACVGPWGRSGSLEPPVPVIEFLEPEALASRLSRSPATNTQRAEVLRALFREEGCSGAQLRDEEAPDAELPNIVCVLAGETREQIIVGAHFDKVGTGEGVLDNWSGASLLPSLYRSLAARTPRHTFLFIGFTDEELGLVGSTSYVQMLEAPAVARIRAMLNLDSLGSGPMRYRRHGADGELKQLLAEVARSLGTTVRGVRFRYPVRGDAEPFGRRGVPVLTFHSLGTFTLDRINGSRDDLTRIDLDHYHASYRLLATYLAYIDRALSSAPH